MRKGLLFFAEIIKIVIIAAVIVFPIRYFIFQPFLVKGVSMEPTFSNGDYLIIDEISYRFQSPKRGEVIVFKYPFNPSNKFIKRIIGLPGEKIEFRNSQIIITQRFGQQIILKEKEGLKFSQYSLQEKKFVIPENHYFVLGDNCLYSFDSKNWGALAEKYIIGRVFLRLFPFNKIDYFLKPEHYSF